jgi:hypothetical protein
VDPSLLAICGGIELLQPPPAASTFASHYQGEVVWRRRRHDCDYELSPHPGYRSIEATRRFLRGDRLPAPTTVALAPAIIPVGPHGQHSEAMVVPVRLGKIAEAVRQGIKANWVAGSDTPIALVVNNAGRATRCARAPLTGADLGRPTFMRLQRISRCSIRKEAERT